MHNPEIEQDPIQKLEQLKAEYIQLTQEERESGFEDLEDKGQELTPEESTEYKARSKRLSDLVFEISELMKQHNPADNFWAERSADGDKYHENMEGFPQPENIETISKQEVIDSLVQNPEDLSVLNKFLDLREKEVQSSKDTLNVNVEVAEIYRDAGLLEAAKQAFEDAANQAWQEGEDDLYEKIMAEVDKLAP